MKALRLTVLALAPALIVYQHFGDENRVLLDLFALLPLIVLIARRKSLVDRVAAGLLCGSLVMFNLANLVWSYYLLVLDRDAHGSIADLFFMLGWGLLLAYALVLLRQRRGHLGGILDGAVLTTSVGATVLMVVLVPGLSDDGLPVAAQAVALGNLLLGLMTLGAVLGVATGMAGREPALVWGVAGLASAVVGSGAVTAAAAGGTEGLGPWINSALLSAYTACTMSLLTGRGPNVPSFEGVPERLRRGRLALTGAAMVTPPLVALARPTVGSADAALVAVSTVLLVPLVLARLSGLVSDRERAERALAHRASHDPLTGLANRTLLLDHLQDALPGSRPGSSRVLFLAFLDLNGFKTVNDTLGHAAGDRMLQSIAAMLSACVRDTDLVARHGGDEFIVLCPDLPQDDVPGLAVRLTEACDTSMGGVQVTTSIGLLTTDDPSSTPEQLLHEADQRMYAHKQRRHALPHGPLAPATS